MKKTKWRQRLRSTCKWGGVMLCVLLFALWFASRWWCAQIVITRSSGVFVWTFVEQGVFGVTCFMINDDPLLAKAQANDGFKIRKTVQSYWDWWNFGYRTSYSPMRTYFPLWLPFLLIALPTGYLFWSDHRRRMRVGCCEECGYDMTGNTTGKCPECGAVSSARGSATSAL